jgi:hypothetical protein
MRVRRRLYHCARAAGNEILSILNEQEQAFALWLSEAGKLKKLLCGIWQ